MKTTLAAIFAAAVLFTACGSDKQEAQQEPAQQEMQQEAQAAVYYCPMKCEGDKTYSEPGSCPVCGMDLVKEDADAEHEMESHEGHDL